MKTLYRCEYCESFQAAENARRKGLCEETGEQHGPQKAGCEKFQLQWDIRRAIFPRGVPKEITTEA